MKEILNVLQIMKKNIFLLQRKLLWVNILIKMKRIKKKKHEIRFIDSFKFMASSLGGLVENLEKSDITKFIQTKKEFGEKINFMIKKEFIHMII